MQEASRLQRILEGLHSNQRKGLDKDSAPSQALSIRKVPMKNAQKLTVNYTLHVYADYNRSLMK